MFTELYIPVFKTRIRTTLFVMNSIFAIAKKSTVPTYCETFIAGMTIVVGVRPSTFRSLHINISFTHFPFLV